MRQALSLFACTFLLALVFAPLQVTALRAGANSSLVMKYHNRGYTWGTLDEHQFNTALLELASERYDHC